MPKPPKSNYTTEPTWTELKRMTREELESIPNFKIENQHGSIEFLGPTDITYCDLAQLVTISSQEVEVYPLEE